jgi:hypothetical protein
MGSAPFMMNFSHPSLEPWRLDDSKWQSWLLVFVVNDFIYYWFHRFSAHRRFCLLCRSKLTHTHTRRSPPWLLAQHTRGRSSGPGTGIIALVALGLD